MRAAAPAVLARLGSGAMQRSGVAGLHALAAAVAVQWLLMQCAVQGWTVPLAPAWVPAAAALVAAVAFRRQRPLPTAVQWDGARWLLHLPDGSTREGAVQLRLDLGHALVLRQAVAGKRETWFLATRRQAGPDWHGLRVALFHPAAPEPSSAAGRT